MTAQALKHQTTTGVATAEITGSVSSSDGTTIGYRQFGHGPALVVVHGTFSSGHNHRQLALSLADAFTVVVPDRRGRGLSGPLGPDDSLRTEVEDLRSLLGATGARAVFGVSAGAIVALETALDPGVVDRVAVFEPPAFADRAAPATVLARFDREVARGDIAAALITAMKGAQLGPPIFNALPRWITERLTARMMREEERRGSGDYIPVRRLAPTLHQDIAIALDVSGDLDRYATLQADVLLLGGSRSPAYLAAALDRLAAVLPSARRIELAGLDHAASWNADRGGDPGPVAEVLRGFFA
jgi:pimeloyl-ACP methyl ester carboxylesterase